MYTLIKDDYVKLIKKISEELSIARSLLRVIFYASLHKQLEDKPNF